MFDGMRREYYNIVIPNSILWCCNKMNKCKKKNLLIQIYFDLWFLDKHHFVQNDLFEKGRAVEHNHYILRFTYMVLKAFDFLF